MIRLWSGSRSLMFVEDGRKFFDEGREGSPFPLVEPMDLLYRLAPEKSPFGPIGEGSHYPAVFRRCFFVCHRTFLSSGMMTASGLPKDGEAIIGSSKNRHGYRKSALGLKT